MNLISALGAYLVTILICFGIFAVYFKSAKKKQQKFHVGYFLCGLAFFIVSLIGYYLLLKYHLSIKDGVSDYYNTAVYRIAIISLITLLIFILIWIFSMRVFVKRQALTECKAFFAGFTCSAALLLGLYSVFMFLHLAVMGCTSELLAFDTTKLAFQFAPETYVFVFAPFWGHVSFAVAFASFFFFGISLALILNRMATKVLPFKISLVVFLLTALVMVIMINLIAFMKMLSLPHYVMAIIMIILDILLFGLICLVHRERMDESEYEEQFS